MSKNTRAPPVTWRGLSALTPPLWHRRRQLSIVNIYLLLEFFTRRPPAWKLNPVPQKTLACPSVRFLLGFQQMNQSLKQNQLLRIVDGARPDSGKPPAKAPVATARSAAAEPKPAPAESQKPDSAAAAVRATA
jgi:hypothetical protein